MNTLKPDLVKRNGISIVNGKILCAQDFTKPISVNLRTLYFLNNLV